MRFGLKRQPWICSPAFDLIWIVGPPLVVSVVAISFSRFFHESLDVSPLAWLALIVGVDVAHVYSTLYRTYLDGTEFKKHSTLYTLVPLSCWVSGVLVYSIHSHLFWTALAYLAVFHFVRQQYGFMMIYARSDSGVHKWERAVDQGAVYLATLYPVAFWHSNARNFHWFVDGDFFTLPRIVERTALGVYVLFLALYVFKEVRAVVRSHGINLPKNLLLLGTAASWYFGIVHFNGDLAFTFTNVVAHGVPYVALIWLYGHRKWNVRWREGMEGAPFLMKLFSPSRIPLFLGLLAFLAFFEEGLWDSLVWREHGQIFGNLYVLPALGDTATLSWVVPLLAVPQATHYVLDGFIWRFRKGDREVRSVLFEERNGGRIPS